MSVGAPERERRSGRFARAERGCGPDCALAWNLLITGHVSFECTQLGVQQTKVGLLPLKDQVRTLIRRFRDQVI